MGRHKKIEDDALIKGVRECLLQNGPSVTTAVIADCVGVSQAAIFKRYATKEDLVLAALAPPPFPESIDAIAKGPDNRDLREQIMEIVQDLNAHLESAFPRIEILRMSGINPHKFFKHVDEPPPLRMIRLLTGWFRRAQRKGQIRKANPQALALLLMGALHSRTMTLHMESDTPLRVSSKSYVRTIVDTLLNGVSLEDEE